MAAIDPTDYPFNIDEEGWPEKVYAPQYPFEYYYDNGRISNNAARTVKYKNDNHYEPDTNIVRRLPIRRHTPGTTDPTFQRISPRPSSQTSNGTFTIERNLSPVKPSSPPIRNHSPVSIDPDDRPIKPMKDTTVYKKSSTLKKVSPPKKTVPPTPKMKPIPPKTKPPSPQYDSDSAQSPPPPLPPAPSLPPRPAVVPVNNVSARRPIRIDLIPKTPFGVQSRRNPSRPIIVEEYVEDEADDDEDYPVVYVEHVPEKIITYRDVSGITTRELENYRVSKSRRNVRVRSPPIETIIYET